jgi:serine phosphatase RsbU (regulator of sigma subunit)
MAYNTLLIQPDRLVDNAMVTVTTFLDGIDQHDDVTLLTLQPA